MRLPLNLKPIKSPITQTQIDASEYFAEHSDYSKYNERGQSYIDWMKRQCADGKKCEYAVYNYLKSRGFDITEVDVNIYPPHKKSYIQDLKCNGEPLHIKSQSIEQGKKYQTSFTFQYADQSGNSGRGNRDSHAFNNPESQDGVFFCTIDGNDITIVVRTRICVFHKYNLYKLPQKEELKKSKRVVYLKDLEALQRVNI